jgi:hypothetical protein
VSEKYSIEFLFEPTCIPSIEFEEDILKHQIVSFSRVLANICTPLKQSIRIFPIFKKIKGSISFEHTHRCCVWSLMQTGEKTSDGEPRALSAALPEIMPGVRNKRREKRSQLHLRANYSHTRANKLNEV